MATISLSTRHGRISAWKATPPVPARGAVVVVQEIFGVNSHIRQVCDRFAQRGYVAVAPAVFDFASPGVELGYDEAGIARGKELAEQVGFGGALDGIRAAHDHLEADYRVAVVGFCWGATAAFLANTRIAMRAVCYYGARTVPFLRERPKAPLLMHFGENDPSITAEDIAQHREHLPTADIIVWPGVGHGFNCDQRADYNAEVAAQAMDRTMAFLRKHLQHSPGG